MTDGGSAFCQMHRRRREREGRAGVFDDAPDGEVHVLPDLQVLVLVGRHGEVHDLDVLARIAKVLEGDGDDRVVDLVAVFEVLPYIAADALQLLGRGVVGQADPISDISISCSKS